MLKRSFLFNLFLVILVCVGLLMIFFKSLNWLTNHGQETKVPALQGKNMKEAIKILKKQGFTIQIDSAYQSYKNPLEVIYQEPEAGAIVKIGRTIFLTINRKSVPTIPMPNLVNLSFRNAILTMQSYRLEMGDTTFRPDLAAGSVLEQWINGRQIRPGMQVPYGSKVDLVIGQGLSDIVDVPNLIGMTWYEAKQTIESLSLSYNILWDGAITDSMNAIIYQQVPEALNELDFKNAIPAGDLIDVHIMQKPSEELLKQNQPGSAKFLGEDSMEHADDAPILRPRDTLTKKRNAAVPGMGAPTTNKSKETTSKPNTGNNKPSSNGVRTPKPKQEKPNNPVQKNNDAIGNEFD